MLLVLPATSAIRPISYLVPQPYEYHPSQDYHHHHGAPRFAVPSYPAPELDFFHQPSAEELEERQYRRALEVVANHRRRQVEKEATIRRQQLAGQRYFVALAEELERRRQEELVAARRAEFIRSQQARARLVVAERQHALNTFLQQLKGAQQITRQPHVVKRKPLVDALKQRLATESDADITEPIQNILSSLGPSPVQSEKPKDSGEDAAKLIKNLLSSIFPDLVFHAQPQPTPSIEGVQPSVSDKGKGRARAADVEEVQKPAPTSEFAGESFADILRHVTELSKSTTAPRSPHEAGPSELSSPPSTRQAATEREQGQIDRAIALSSVEHVQDTLTKLQADFVLPAKLEHYTPSTDDRDETASVSSVSSSDLTKLIPYTSVNKPVYKYENELNGLLEELDRIDSHGDAEVRERRKEVVKAVEKALEGVEQGVGQAVEKRLSLLSAATSAPGGPLRGFDVDEDIVEDVAPAQELVDTPVFIDDIMVPEPLTPAQVEETVAAPADQILPESDTPIVAYTIADLPIEPTSTESDAEASTVTIAPASVELTSVTEPDPTTSQVQANATATVDTFLLPEQVSPPSPANKPQEIDSDTDEEVLVLDSDTEKSDWSDLKH